MGASSKGKSPNSISDIRIIIPIFGKNNPFP
jgi:hypothetical protein